MRRKRHLPALALLALALVHWTQPVAAQTQTGAVGGFVREQGTDRPLAGVVITIEGTQLSGLTNREGRYLIPNVPAGRHVLRPHLLGYASPQQEVAVAAGGTATLDFIIQQTAIALDEVVVTGTAGRQERRAQAASIATIGAAEIVATAPVKSVSEIISARQPGISVVQSSGSSGTAQQIRIRGAASVNLSNEPLVFIDGVLADSRITMRGIGVGGQAMSRLNDINPEDIESIEIVKGPAAATLYGADASAGVIQILTKRGRMGADRFAQSITTEYTTIDHNFTPPDNYLACSAANTQPTSAGTPACHGLEPGTVVSDNPIERYGAFRTGTYRSLTWTGRGGGSNFGYFASIGADREDGTLPNNWSDRTTGRFNFNFAPRPDLLIDAGYGYTRNNTALPDNDNNAFGYLGGMLGDPRTVGTVQDGWFAAYRTPDNIARLENQGITVRNQPAVTVRYNPVPWLSNRITVGADLSRTEATQFVPRTDEIIFSARLANGDITETVTSFDTYTLDYLGNIQNRLGAAGQWSSDLSFGLQLSARRDEFVQASGNGLVTNAARSVSAAAERTGTQQVFHSRQVGWLAQWQGGWQDRLFLQLGARVDRNSAFGTAADAIFLPKIGVSWVTSEEPFWQRNVGFINTLRLRAAFGTTGRSPDPGASLETYEAAPFALTETAPGAGVVPLNPGNFELRPERGEEFEAGFDAGLFNDRLGLELTYFNKVTRDLLLLRPLPPSLGFDENPWQNIGEVLNRGLELGLRATLVNRPTFGWDARLALNTLHNEITSMGDVEPFNVTNSYNRHTVGRQLGAFHSLRSREIIATAGDERCPLNADDVHVPCVIVSDTLEFAGNFLPTLEGSLSTSIGFLRNFRAYAQIDWKTGHTMFNNTAYFRETQVVRARERVVEDALSPEERLRRYGPFVRENGDPADVGEMKEAYMESGDFARLREVSLTWNAPLAWAAAFRASSASLTLAGRNLGLWTDYSGFDPEVVSGIAGNQFLRQEFLTVPPARRWVLRVNFGF